MKDQVDVQDVERDVLGVEGEPEEAGTAPLPWPTVVDDGQGSVRWSG